MYLISVRFKLTFYLISYCDITYKVMWQCTSLPFFQDLALNKEIYESERAALLSRSNSRDLKVHRDAESDILTAFPV